jgi:hypothetical protein
MTDGTSATRRSPGKLSRGTPTIIYPSPDSRSHFAAVQNRPSASFNQTAIPLLCFHLRAGVIAIAVENQLALVIRNAVGIECRKLCSCQYQSSEF